MKKVVILCLAILIVLGMNVYSFAQNEDVDVILNKQITVTYNGSYQEFSNANGTRIYPLSYEGTTYLPIRSLSSLFNLKIKWDGQANSVMIGEGELDTTSSKNVAAPSKEVNENIKVLLNEDIKIYFESKIQTFKDANGKVVYPLSYNGTTYLPIRAVSNLFDLDIAWDGNNNMVTIKNKEQKGTIIVGDRVNGFIPERQSRDISDYDSFSNWREVLKNDMIEHNNLAEEEKNKYLEIAEENAKKYIKNKYGFEPLFIDKKAEYSTSMVGGTDDAFVGWKNYYSGNVLLKFQKDGNDYYVLISGKDGDLLGYDNYQYAQVKQEVIDVFNKLANSTAYNAEISYGKSFEISYNDGYTYNLVNTYFDGKNIKDTISNASILMEYGNDIDLNKLNIDFVDNVSKVLVLKYKSQSDFKQAKDDFEAETKNHYGKSHLHIIDGDILGFDMPEKALHIQEYLAIENSNKKIKKINIAECDGVYAVQFGRNIPIEISKCEIASADNFKYLNYNYEQLSSSYSIKYDMSDIEKIDTLNDQDLFIYFPLEKLKDISKYEKDSWTNRFEIGIQSVDKDGNTKYERAGGSKSLSITHFNGRDYLTLEFGSYYGMERDSDYRFVLLGYSVR